MLRIKDEKKTDHLNLCALCVYFVVIFFSLHEIRNVAFSVAMVKEKGVKCIYAIEMLEQWRLKKAVISEFEKVETNYATISQNYTKNKYKNIIFFIASHIKIPVFKRYTHVNSLSSVVLFYCSL